MKNRSRFYNGCYIVTFHLLGAYNDRDRKGGILLEDIGYIQVNAFTSIARIPLENVAVSVTTQDGTAVAMRLTDRNGMIRPIEIPVPAKSAGLTPTSDVTPYTSVNLYAKLSGYEQAEYEAVQVFPGTVTTQNMEFIPQPELPASWSKIGVFVTPAQNH